MQRLYELIHVNGFCMFCWAEHGRSEEEERIVFLLSRKDSFMYEQNMITQDKIQADCKSGGSSCVILEALLQTTSSEY